MANLNEQIEQAAADVDAKVKELSKSEIHAPGAGVDAPTVSVSHVTEDQIAALVRKAAAAIVQASGDRTEEIATAIRAKMKSKAIVPAASK